VQSHRTPKSRGSETTFVQDVCDPSELCETLHALAEEVFADLSGHALRGRTATLKLRYGDFTTITRSKTFDDPIPDAGALYRAVRELLFAGTEAHARAVRLIGVSVSSLLAPDEPEQLWLPFSL
jgi:DNA polymerase-4